MNLCCQLAALKMLTSSQLPQPGPCLAIFQSSKSILISAGAMYYLENIKHHSLDIRDSNEYMPKQVLGE